MKKNGIFISYRRDDTADVAGRIYDRLIQEFGKGSVFKDVDSIPFGVDFREYLNTIVPNCKVLLAVIGDRWINISDDTGKRRLDNPQDFVRIEITSALASNIPVIPLIVKNAGMPSEEALPEDLKKIVYRQGIFIRYDPDFHRDVDRLIGNLSKLISEKGFDSKSVGKKQAFLVGNEPKAKIVNRLVKINDYKGKSIYVYNLLTEELTQEADSKTPDIEIRIHRYRTIGHEIEYKDMFLNNKRWWIDRARSETERLGLEIG